MAALAHIERGREYFSSKRYKSALESFTKAANLCECCRGKHRPRCRCKDFEKAAIDGGRGAIFHEAMHKCQCEVGKTFNKCSERMHIMALDYRAATLEAMERHDLAQRDAESLLELSPRSLEGYLRLGKVFRLQGKMEAAWNIYNAGVDLGRSDGRGGDPKLKLLVKLREPLQKRFYRRDPISLPHELLEQILLMLDIRQLCGILRVSKRWYNVIDKNPTLWRDLRFENKRKVPGMRALRNISRRAGMKCRSLIIADAGSFRLDDTKLKILTASQNITNLELRGMSITELTLNRDAKILSRLTHITLTDILLGSPDFLKELLAITKDTVRYLSISGLPLNSDGAWPLMPQLQTLRIRGLTDVASLAMYPLASVTPNLEKLWLHTWSASHDGIETDGEKAWTAWPKLAEITLEGSCSSNGLTIALPHPDAVLYPPVIQPGGVPHFLYRRFPPLHADKMRVLDLRLDASKTNLVEDFVFGYFPYLGVDSNHAAQSFPNLEVFRLTTTLVEPAKLEVLLSDTLRSGKLRELGINCGGDFDFMPARGFVRMFAFLRGAPIRVLALHNFIRPNDYVNIRAHDGGVSDGTPQFEPEELTLGHFIKSFPDLEELEIESPMCDLTAFCALAAEIITHGKIKIMYQGTVAGVNFDKLRELGDQHGVKVLPLSKKAERW